MLRQRARTTQHTWRYGAGSKIETSARLRSAPGVEYFRHDEVGRIAHEHNVLDRRLTVLFEDLREARVKADYFRDHCTQAEAREYLESAKSIVEALLGAGTCDEH